MKNGKKTAAMAMLLCLAMLLCGCHGGDGQGELMESADIEKTVYYSLDEARQYEVVFWAKNDTNKVQTAQYRQAIADFEALYPIINTFLNKIGNQIYYKNNYPLLFLRFLNLK